MAKLRLDWLKKFLSHFTDRKIRRHIGITTDDSLIMEQVPSQADEENVRASLFGVKYVLRKDVGKFEFIGTVRKKDGTSAQRLRHILTGDTFDVGMSTFKLLFEKE